LIAANTTKLLFGGIQNKMNNSEASNAKIWTW